MKRTLTKKLLSLALACILFTGMSMEAWAANVITVDLRAVKNAEVNSIGNYMLDDGSFTNDSSALNIVFRINSAGGNIERGYSCKLTNCASNPYDDYGKPLHNRGTIVSTDGTIVYTTNYGTIENGTFTYVENDSDAAIIENGTFTTVSLTRGTINGGTIQTLQLESGGSGTINSCTITGEFQYLPNSIYTNYTINGITLAQGAKITIYDNMGTPIDTVTDPGTYNFDSSTNAFVLVATPPASSASSSGSSDKKKDPFDSYTDSLDKQMENAKAGETVILDAAKWHSLPITTIRHMQKHNNVAFEIRYDYRGEKFKVIVPIGATFDDSIPWYGPYKMSSLFGRTMME